MTKFQALFVKYLSSRMCDYGKCNGTSLRNIAMYYYGRYPDWHGFDIGVDTSLKWYEQDFLTSQIDAMILIDQAATVLGDYNSIEGTNWNPSSQKLT